MLRLPPNLPLVYPQFYHGVQKSGFIKSF